MAKWSAKREEEKKAKAAEMRDARITADIVGRLAVFAAFRHAGWEVAAVTNVWGTLDNGGFKFLPDDVKLLDSEINFRVKMPGAYPARVRTRLALLRLAKGVGYGG